MKMRFLLLVAAMSAVGCTEPGPINRVQVLSPGRAMRLAYRIEMRYSTTTVEEERRATWLEKALQPNVVTVGTETRWDSIEWGEAELALRVAAIPGSQNLRATMTVQRFRTGNTYGKQGEEKKEESHEFEQGPTTRPGTGTASGEDGLDKQVRDAEFIAVVDPNGWLVSADIKGTYWNARKKELAEAVKQGATQAQVDQAIRGETPGIFPALEDATAYLPPQGTRPGQSWHVRREDVLPYHAYGFYMFTNGCGYSLEDSTCSLKSIWARPSGSIAIISIRGKRFPRIHAPSMPERVKFLELTGELEVNLTTGAVEKLRLESTPAWAKPKGYESMYLKFVEAISLKLA